MEANKKRCFTFIEEGIDCMMKIIVNKDNLAHNQIFNIGNPDNHFPIEFVSDYMIQWVKEKRPKMAVPKKIYVSDKNYYGESYEDVAYRIPSIAKANALLQWQPKVGIEELLNITLEHYIKREHKMLNVALTQD